MLVNITPDAKYERSTENFTASPHSKKIVGCLVHLNQILGNGSERKSFTNPFVFMFLVAVACRRGGVSVRRPRVSILEGHPITEQK